MDIDGGHTMGGNDEGGAVPLDPLECAVPAQDGQDLHCKKAVHPSYRRSDGSSIVQTTARRPLLAFSWDVFISYRVGGSVLRLLLALDACVRLVVWD